MRPQSSFLVLLVSVTSVHAWSLKATKPKPTQPELCRKPPFLGSCQPIMTPWYYDITRKSCQQIGVGLCSGGSNRFLSQEKCMTVCERLTKKVPIACVKPPVTVSCGVVRHAWYFDANSSSCKMLSYTDPACDSAGNRFLTELKCQGVCLPTAKPKPICSQDPEPDRCLLSKKQWHFDFRNNRCIRFPKGCGKGANSFATYEKCMSKCSYNQLTAACPTCEQKLQNEQRLLGKPGVPSQVGPLGLPGQSIQPGLPVQPGQPSSPGLGLPSQSNQPGQSGLPLETAGSGQPGLPSLIGHPGQASSAFPPGKAAQSGQSSRPGAALPGQQGISPQSTGRNRPGQTGVMGKPGQVSPVFPPSTSAQSGQSSRPGVGLPNHPAQPGLSPVSAGLGQPILPGSLGRPVQVGPNLQPSIPPVRGQPSGHDAGVPGHAVTSLSPGPTGKPGLSGVPTSPTQPGYGGSSVTLTTPTLSGPPFGRGVGKPGLTGQPLNPVSTSGPVPPHGPGLPARPGYGGNVVSLSTLSQSAQAPSTNLPNKPIAPNNVASPGVTPPSGVATQNSPVFPGAARKPPAKREFRPFRSTLR